CRVLRSYLGSYNGLYELYNNKVSVSSIHLWNCNSNEYNTPFVKIMLPGVPCVLINLTYRNHGLFVKSNNPKNINSFEDLIRSDIKFINREKGSGTRILLDEKLNSLNINPNLINGYENEELSATSAATFVARGIVDVALGHEKVATQVDGIDFIPLQKERYDLVIKEKDLYSPVCKAIIEILNSDKFQSEIQCLGGYDISDMGKIIANTSNI
ncbi:substrate-binding domain-containing protein, partial [Romboutsia sp.]|uniref:substrate-binding domain-containing protein n=1 Tax=Romboutsia sp. TaxID=1965302 RepID=UPI003F3EE943